MYVGQNLPTRPVVIIVHFYSTFFSSPPASYIYYYIFCLRPLSTMLEILTLLDLGFDANTFPHSTTSVT